MALTTTTLGNKVRGVYNNVKNTFPAAETDTSAGIGTLDTIVAGATYTTTAIATATTSSGSGTGCTVTYTAVAGGVTAVVIVEPGTGYALNDTQTIIAGNSAATFDVLTLTKVVSSVDTLNKHVTGLGTTFLADVHRGDFIWFTSNDKLIEVEEVVDNTNLYLKTPVTTVTLAPFRVVKRNGFKTVSWNINSAGTADIDGVTYPLGTSETIDESEDGSRIVPLLVDSTANSNVVYVTGI